MDTITLKLRYLVLLILFPTLIYSGTIKYVAPDGSSSNGGTSKTDAWTLHKANAELGAGGIDTIKMYGGTYNEDLYQSRNGTSGAMLVYMAATDTSYPVIVGYLNGTYYDTDDDWRWQNQRNVAVVTGDYVKLYRLGFMCNDYTKATAATYYVQMAGDYGIMDRCWVSSGSTDVAHDYWIHYYKDRGIVIGGSHTTVMNTKVFRTPGIGIAIDGGAADHSTLYRDTITNQGESNFVLTYSGGAGVGYTGHLIEQCYMDTSWEEDNIQINSDYADSSAQILVRNSILKNAGENAFDPKGAWRSMVEGCTVWGTKNDDDGDQTVVGISDSHDGTGAAFCRGTPSRMEHFMIYRNNVLYSNGDGMDYSGSFMAYHNTFANNRRRWNTAQKSSGAYNMDAGTTGGYRGWVLNNIVIGMPNNGGTGSGAGALMRLKPNYNTSGGTGTGTPAYHVNGNLYWDYPDSMAYGGKFQDIGDSPDTNLGMTNHVSFVTGTICKGGEDSSIWADPGFENAPVYPTAWVGSYDFRPKSTSAAKGKAVALSQIVTGTTSATQTLGVDTWLFRDDYTVGTVWGAGFTLYGDSLLIVHASTVDIVRISSIDHHAGTVTFNKSITTATNDRIYFFSGGKQWRDIGAPIGIITDGGGPGETIPDIPTQIVQPTANAWLIPPDYTFKWRKVTGATKYKFNYGTTNWTTTYLFREDFPDTFVNVINLPENLNLAWGIAAGNSAGYSNFSQDFLFGTLSYAVTSDTVYLDWNNTITVDTLTANTRILMSNSKRRDNILTLYNPNNKTVTWPTGITWSGLSTAPQPTNGESSSFLFIRNGTTFTGFELRQAVGTTGGATQGWVSSNFVSKASYPTVIGIACSDETTALTASTSVEKMTFRMPYAMTVTGIRASVTTAPTGSSLHVDIHESGTTILGTKCQIDVSAKSSYPNSTQATITDASLADDSEIKIFVDQIGSTIAGAGLKVWIIGTRTLP